MGRSTHADDDRIETALRLIREHGGRATMARRGILQALVDHEADHPTVEHITSSLQQAFPDVAESTVYRFLDELERLEVVRAVRLGHGPTVYHFADDTDHHHLVCTECDAVVEVPSRTFDTLRHRLQHDFAFVIDPQHLTITGRCTRCDDGAGVRRAHTHTHRHHE